MSKRPAGLCLLLLLLLHDPGLQAQSRPERFELDASRSRLYVVTHRVGLLSFLGHEHAILATRWSGELCLDPEAPVGAWGRVEVETRGLVIDSDEARALAGLGRGPSRRQVESIQRQLLDEEHLDAEGHPRLSLEVSEVRSGKDPVLTAHGVLTIRGVSREAVFPLVLEPSGPGERSVRVGGVLQVRQSDHGIEPESVAGVVRVADPVDIHFDLIAVPVGRSCSR